MEHPESAVESNADRLADLRVELDRREARTQAIRVAAAYLAVAFPRQEGFEKVQLLYAATLAGLTMRGMADIAAEVRGLTTHAVERRIQQQRAPSGAMVDFRMPRLCS